MLGRGRPVVGLDIGSCLVKVVELQNVPKTPVLSNYGVSRLLPDAIVDGEVMDREVVIDTVKTLLETRGVRSRDVATAVAGRGVIVKKISMEKMKESEAKERIRWEAEQHVPFDIADVSLDFQIVNPEVGEGQMEVLLVAAKNEVVNSHVSLLREIGLTPAALDVAYFAVQNTFEVNYETSPGELIALVNVGAEATNISFVADLINHFSRDISTAGNDCSQRLQKQFGISRDEAMDLLKGESTLDVEQEGLSSVFKSFSEDLATGIERVLPYLPGGAEKMERVVLSGGGATIPGLSTYLGERFGVPVEVMDPFQKIGYDPAIFGTESPQKVGPILVQAIGLALRGG